MNENKICEKCHHSCLTCTGPGEDQCLTCDTNQDRRYFNSGHCPCNPGFYDDGVNSKCNSCHYTCQECKKKTINLYLTFLLLIKGTGPNYNDCSSCLQSTHRTIQGTTCPCDLRYYDN